VHKLKFFTDVFELFPEALVESAFELLINGLAHLFKLLFVAGLQFTELAFNRKTNLFNLLVHLRAGQAGTVVQFLAQAAQARVARFTEDTQLILQSETKAFEALFGGAVLFGLTLKERFEPGGDAVADLF